MHGGLPEACSAERALVIVRVRSPQNGSVCYSSEVSACEQANNRDVRSAEQASGLQNISWLVGLIYCFTSHSRIFHMYGDVTRPIARHSGPLSREGSLLCNTCRDAGPQFFWSHPKDRPALFSHLLRHTRGVEDLFKPRSSRVRILM
jgi:hypothetical protein